MSCTSIEPKPCRSSNVDDVPETKSGSPIGLIVIELSVKLPVNVPDEAVWHIINIFILILSFIAVSGILYFHHAVGIGILQLFPAHLQ